MVTTGLWTASYLDICRKWYDLVGSLCICYSFEGCTKLLSANWFSHWQESFPQRAKTPHEPHAEIDASTNKRSLVSLVLMSLSLVQFAAHFIWHCGIKVLHIHTLSLCVRSCQCAFHLTATRSKQKNKSKCLIWFQRSLTLIGRPHISRQHFPHVSWQQTTEGERRRR